MFWLRRRRNRPSRSPKGWPSSCLSVWESRPSGSSALRWCQPEGRVNPGEALLPPRLGVLQVAQLGFGGVELGLGFCRQSLGAVGIFTLGGRVRLGLIQFL